MRLVILGGPGAGKSTLSKQLCHQQKIPQISVGEILREAVAAQIPLGQKAQPYVEKGELVPDEIMIQLMRQQLLQPEVRGGWLIEGYPRTAFQAEELDFLLDDLEQQLDWAIYLEVPEDVMIERTLVRSRADDQPDIIQRRVQQFYERTIPILEYYDHRQKLLTVDANRSPEVVEQEILQKLKFRR